MQTFMMVQDRERSGKLEVGAWKFSSSRWDTDFRGLKRLGRIFFAGRKPATMYQFDFDVDLSSLTELFIFFLLMILNNSHTNSLSVNRLGNYYKIGKI